MLPNSLASAFVFASTHTRRRRKDDGKRDRERHYDNRDLNQKRDWLTPIVDMLNALSAMTLRDGSPMLHYFVEFAAAQARDERAALTKAIVVEGAAQAYVAVH